MNIDFDEMLEHLESRVDKTVEAALGEGIKKGFIKTRESEMVIVRKADSDGFELHKSIVLDYLGGEKIEELQKENEYLKKEIVKLHEGIQSAKLTIQEFQGTFNRFLVRGGDESEMDTS